MSDLQKWNNYLANLNKPPVNLSFSFAEKVKLVWQNLCQQVGKQLRPPVADHYGELGFLFSWNSEKYCIEIAIEPDGTFEWFYRDRVSGAYYGSNDERLSDAPEELINLFVKYCLKEEKK